MEFIDGPNLRDHVQKQGVLVPADAVAVVRDLARALAHAHASGIIHRDVKPENVLLAPTGKAGAFPWTAKLVDLGLARPSGKDNGEMNLTMQGMLMGTPATMAPEQFDDPDHVDFRADIYGLGCVLYHALTGSPAFNSRTLGEMVSSKVSGAIPNPATLRATIPREVCDLVTRMLARDKTSRPQSYDEVIARCDALVGSSSSPAGPSQAMWWAGAVMIAVIGGGGVFAATRGANTQAPSAPPAAGTPAVTAPPVAVPMVAAPTAFGAPVPLFEAAREHRLDAWTRVGNAEWIPVEESDDLAISGSMGMISHPVDAGPWRIEGVLHPGTSTSLGIGVAGADGASCQVTVENLSGVLLEKCDTGRFPDKVKAASESSKKLPLAEKQPFRLILTGKRLEISISEVELSPIQLSSAPTLVYLTVKAAGPRPASVSDLTISYAK
jgi:hypothetical protein